MEHHEIRRARLGDGVEIARLAGQLGYPASESIMLPRLQRVLASPNDAIFVAYTSGGALAGWIHGYLSQHLESEYRVEIGGLVVDERLQRRGIGRGLIARIEEWALGQGVTQASVRCRQARKEAHAFYESLGYKPTKTQVTFRKTMGKGA